MSSPSMSRHCTLHKAHTRRYIFVTFYNGYSTILQKNESDKPLRPCSHVLPRKPCVLESLCRLCVYIATKVPIFANNIDAIRTIL
jgi:hypothetical protein